MKYDLVIFDLDGTLLNTLDDLASAANRALAEAGYPPRSLAEVRSFIGGGVAQLVRRVVPEGADDSAVGAVLRRFKAIYTENVNVHTKPYPGMRDMLQALRRHGIHTACNSNKVDAATRLLCAAHFGDDIEYALGEREGIPKKPAPDGCAHIMRRFGAEAARTLYVGDGDADILTAENAGVDCAWVSWGFRSRDELAGLSIPRSFDTIDALRAFILSE